MPISNTYQPNGPIVRPGSGSAQANREDLSDIMTMLAPEETPLTSLAKKGKAKSTYHEWPIDKLNKPTNTPVPEGADVTVLADKFANVARIGNFVQKFREPWFVSEEQEAVESAGPQKTARAKSKCMLELKRNVEFAIGSDADRFEQDGSGQAYALRGLGNWIQSAGPTDVAAAYRTPAASILTGPPTETSLNAQIASIFSVNGSVNRLTLVAGTALRTVVSGFTRTNGNGVQAVYNITQPASDKSIKYTVNMYESDFGMVSIVNANPDCVVNANRGYLINPDYYELDTLIPLRMKDLEDQGAGPRGYCAVNLTLAVNDPRAHGKIAY